MEGNIPSGAVQPNPPPFTPHSSPSAQVVGWYLYGILPSSAPFPPLVGVDGRSALVVIVEEGLAALASIVPLEEFGAEPLRRHLEDPQWMEEKVRHHERIVETAMAEAPILPMRFGTIFLSPEGVKRMLQENAAKLQEGLVYLEDKEEWGVKGFSDRRRLQEFMVGKDPDLCRLSEDQGLQSPGRAFLARKRLEELASAKVEAREAELVRSAEDVISRKVVDLVRKPPLPRQATGRRQEMILHLACLVTKDQVKGFLAMLTRWNSAYKAEGFELLATGPWPPYHFAPTVERDACEAS
ncbi:MAG: GvpL/GvpF family gas vesicle protein [candidate division NC10 bacterium]|nr:GvpL/GvpF family gas vesicle protein [candidate division NC10 bacterium]